jgi:hypothetical protein
MEMKAGIGSILFLWSNIERELAQQIAVLGAELGTPCPHSIRQKIDHWVSLQAAVCEARPAHRQVLEDVLARLTHTLEIRNRISHGVIAIQADPFGRHGNARLTTDLNGETRVLSYREMEEAMGTLEHMKSAIMGLGFATQEKDLRKADSTYAGIRLNHLV